MTLSRSRRFRKSPRRKLMSIAITSHISAEPKYSHSTSLPDDLVRLITESLLREKDLADLKRVALSSRFLREEVASCLYENLYFGSPGDASTFRKESQGIAKYTKSLTVKIKTKPLVHSWEAPNPPLRSLWKVLSEDFIHLNTLTILPPAIRSTITSFDPPRYDLDLAIPLTPSTAFLPHLVKLELPFNQIGMLKLLSNAPDLEEVAISAVDPDALRAYNVLARKAERLVDVLDAQLPQVVESANGFQTHLRERYYYIPPCLRVKRVKIEARPELNLKETLDFVQRLFPNVEQLSGHREGTPGHITVVNDELLQRLKTLTSLRDLTLVYAPSAHPPPPPTIVIHSIWGVEISPPTLLTINGNLTLTAASESIPMGRRSTETSVVPSSPLIRATMDPLVMELAREMPKLQVIRHVYDDEADWTRDRRKRWEFQAHIDGRQEEKVQVSVDESADGQEEEGARDEDVEEVEQAAVADELATTDIVPAEDEEITWTLHVATLPIGDA